MKPTPKDWPRISAAVFYEDPAAAIDWLCRAFGFTVRIKVEGEGGSILHSELEYGEGLVMVGDVKRHHRRVSPRAISQRNTQSLQVYVDDVLAHSTVARAAGAVIVDEPKITDYGEEYWSDRIYQVEDLEGHAWWFAERLRSAR